MSSRTVLQRDGNPGIDWPKTGKEQWRLREYVLASSDLSRAEVTTLKPSKSKEWRNCRFSFVWNTVENLPDVTRIKFLRRDLCFNRFLVIFLSIQVDCLAMITRISEVSLVFDRVVTTKEMEQVVSMGDSSSTSRREPRWRMRSDLIFAMRYKSINISFVYTQWFHHSID